LTTLAGDDTPGTVRRLCAKGIRPVQSDIVEALHVEALHIQVAAVCVYHNLVPIAVEALHGSNIPVAAVSTGFPAGQISYADKIREIEASVARAPGKSTL
jgi:deoxyribose-phosphate aldolase